MSIESLHHGQHSLSGTLELTPGVVRLTTNSTERAQQGQAILESLLQGLIGPALCSLQTPEQLLEQRRTHGQATGRQEPVDDIDPEIKAEIIQHTLDRHYRRVLDEPVPALGDKTPLQCVRSKNSREKVIEWLKLLENNEERRAASQGQQPYDSRWMWDELKLGWCRAVRRSRSSGVQNRAFTRLHAHNATIIPNKQQHIDLFFIRSFLDIPV